MKAFPKDTTPRTLVPAPTGMRTFFSAARYLTGKVLTILATIFVGVFLTMLIVNYPGGVGGAEGKSPFEVRLEGQIYYVMLDSVNNGLIPLDAEGNASQKEWDALHAKLRDEAGLNLPKISRYFLWTYKALTFNWGELDTGSQPNVKRSFRDWVASNAVLQYLPNTLLLVGTAYLLVFLIGMPLSLYLARHYGGWWDRLLSILSPISSVPGWVFAILLVTIFAVQLRWLPVAGMFDFHKPTEPILYALALLRHMILPVMALVLSLLFQLVYTWRTFLIIYSEEDYVDLARAKGLNTRLLEKQYILKPALPYIITSFATSLIGFWQLTVALEKVFAWPGIGTLYIDALPNYWKEGMAIGDLMIVIQIVVTFSYLLGILVFVLDLAYVFVDPRIHLIPSSNLAQNRGHVKANRGRGTAGNAGMKGNASGFAPPITSPVLKRTFSLEQFLRNARESMMEMHERVKLFTQQLRMYPSAIFGLTVITLLFAGSIYALLALPYEQIGQDYDQNRSTGRNVRPRTAAPSWLNVFHQPPLLSTLILDEKSSDVSISTRTLENGWVEKTTTMQFDYSYKETPSDVFLYIDSDYAEKIPFISFEWTTPDGRVIDLKPRAMGGEENYDMQTGTFASRMLLDHPEWRNWFVTDGQYPTPAYKLLFATPGSTEPAPLRGRYQLKITSLLFDDASDVQPQLVLLGQVYGWAGTDYWRRDLIVPLFWGMPITLLIGFLGTFITTLIAMLLPAIGVWFGGPLDNFVQRITEINMVLPGLAIAVLVNALLGVNIWIILAIVVVLNALGAPIKSFRSAFLQAKEAPYIEMARSYGASNSRIITRYLIPRILPILIPSLVAQIPSFIFLEATLGFFNIRSTYPSWGRIIYEGLSRGALYGSPYWVLEPIFLLLLTGLAFAMLGLALERILNPRVIDQGAGRRSSRYKAGGRRNPFTFVNGRTAISIIVILVLLTLVGSSNKARAFADSLVEQLSPFSASASGKPTSNPEKLVTVDSATSSLIEVTATVSQASATPTSLPLTSTATAVPTFTVTLVLMEPTAISTAAASRPETHTLQQGEYPYCIARRFNVDPTELLKLNGLSDHQSFYTGMVLQIPDSSRAFPGDRQLKMHPDIHVIFSPDETIHSVACAFGDVLPEEIARSNQLSLDSDLSVGQQLIIP